MEVKTIYSLRASANATAGAIASSSAAASAGATTSASDDGDIKEDNTGASFKVKDVQMIPVKKKAEKNVLTRMQCKFSKVPHGAHKTKRGPLSVLYRCVEERIRVKVWTRDYGNIRGICTGYIVAFDRHWNLAMVDVDEVYKNLLPKPRVKRVKKKNKKIANQTESTPSNDQVEPKIIHSTDTDPADRNKSVQKCSTSDGRKERSEKSGKPGSSTNISGRMSSDIERKRDSDRTRETERRRKTGRTDETESSVRSNRSQSQNCRDRHRLNEKKLSGHSPDTRRNFESCSDSKYSDNLTSKNDRTSCKNRSIKQENSKDEYRPLLTRHVNQILIRGDNVVMVALA